MIPYLMFGLAVGVGASILCGTAEMSFMGSYMDQSPIYEVYKVFSVWGQEGFVKAMALSFVNFPAILKSIVNAYFFNYAILGASNYGLVIRIVLTAVVSIPVLVGLFIELVSRLKPT